VIPIFNNAPTIERAIMSCVVQNFTNWEIVCVLDGTTDDSESVILSVINRSGISVKIVRHETNRGTFLARRSGVLATRGDFIMGLDGDDAFAGNIFDSVVRAHRETGADVVQFEMKISRNGGGLNPLKGRTAPKDVLDNEELRKAVIAGNINWNTCLASIERELCLRVFDILLKDLTDRSLRQRTGSKCMLRFTSQGKW
jgi:glycosyltransferase involved in cell wall biosynthesis